MLKIVGKKEAVWCETTYNGSKIKLLIQPVSQRRMSEIRQDNTSREAVHNPEGGVMELVEYLDKTANAKALADAIIQDVEGIGDDVGEKLELTPDNKYEIYLLPKQESDKRPLWEWILEQAGVLQAKKDEGQADDVKNS